MATVNGTNHPYKYNGQEQLKSLGLNVTEMTWRQYDNALGRFHGIDALAASTHTLHPIILQTTTLLCFLTRVD